MAILRCTKKLLTELKTKPSEETIPSDEVGSPASGVGPN